MIIGNGDIAKALHDRDGAIFFASGVSNSRCTDEREFKRERKLLVDTFHKHYKPGICLFYFSSISIDLVVNSYFTHKLAMELMIRGIWPDHNIIRLGNIDWGVNPHTFLNYLRNRKRRHLKYEIRDEYKYMINVDQLLMITDNLPLTGRNRISIFGDLKKVADLI